MMILDFYDFNTIYYQDLWYSYYAFREYDIDTVQRMYNKHIVDMKILSIFFDKIYIPRSHILTISNEFHKDVISRFINSSIFKLFLKNGIVVLSVRPGLSPYEDTERIISRINALPWALRLDSGIKNIQKGDIIVVDSSKWSQNTGKNTINFLKYLDSVYYEGKGKFIELGKQAESDDVPFLHEGFMGALFFSDIDSKMKEKIWRSTNHFYVEIPEKGITGFITYDPEDRFIHQRKCIGGHYIDMRFYHPKVLYQVLRFLLKDDIGKLLFESKDSLFLNIRNYVHPILIFSEYKIPLIYLFRESYHKIAIKMTDLVIELEENIYPDENINLQINYEFLFERAVVPIKYVNFSNIYDNIISAAKSHIEESGLFFGKYFKSKLYDLLQQALNSLLIDLLSPEISEFVAIIKNELSKNAR